MPSIQQRSRAALSPRRILTTWWPLAISWMLMTLESPAQSAFVARLPNAEINLAAWGGIVFPVTLVVSAPIVMMLSASTALCQDADAYRKVYRFTMVLGAILTGIHALVAFTPLYFFVARTLIGAPEEIIAPGRIGLIIIIPWSWSIAYRRLQQGVMIRFGYSKAVGTGTLIRLISNLVVLTIGYTIGTIPGIIVGSSAVAAGVLSEAIYAAVRVRPILREHIHPAPIADPRLTLRSLLAFYIPLVLTSVMNILIQPMGSAALSRMPDALNSLAAWPVINGLIFLLRSPGLAFNEVVVALMGERDAVKPLRKFAILLLSITTILTVVIVSTPLANLWLKTVMALPEALVAISHQALWLTLLLPPQAVLLSWYQGAIMHSKRTRGITESMAIYLAIILIVFGIGIATQRFPGLNIAVVAFELAGIGQALWLWYRSRPAIAHTSS